LVLAFVPAAAVGARMPAATDAERGLPAVASPPVEPDGHRDTELTPKENPAALSNGAVGLLRPVERLNAAKSLRLPSLAAPKGLDASRTDKSDSTTMVLKQPLPIDWDGQGRPSDLGPARGAVFDLQPGSVDGGIAQRSRLRRRLGLGRRAAQSRDGRCACRSEQRPRPRRHHVQAFDAGRQPVFGDAAEQLLGDGDVQRVVVGGAVRTFR